MNPIDYTISFHDEPEARDLAEIPRWGHWQPVVPSYLRIVGTGKAAVHPRTFLNRDEAEKSAKSFNHALYYYAEANPDLGIKMIYGFRIWDSRQGGYRWALMPYKSHTLSADHPFKKGRPKGLTNPDKSGIIHGINPPPQGEPQ